MMTHEQYLRDRDRAIYDHFVCGRRQKWLAKHYELSVSRIKAIVGEQRKLQSNAWSDLLKDGK